MWAGTVWRPLADGLHYRTVPTGIEGTPLHLIQVDLERYRIDLSRAAERALTQATLKELVAGNDAVMAINASFFTPDGKAMGLVIKDGKQVQPLRSAAWGVFEIREGRAAIIHTRDYTKDPKRALAVQTGPRLLINGVMPSFRDASPAPRSGVCITPAKHVLFAATAAPLTLQQFAQALKPYCRDALNLDGGSSTQFYVKDLAGESVKPRLCRGAKQARSDSEGACGVEETSPLLIRGVPIPNALVVIAR